MDLGNQYDRRLQTQWDAEQRALAARVVVQALDPLPRYVAGADVAFSPDMQQVLAAAVVYDRQEQRILEVVHAASPAGVPYIPGYLSFREGPTLLQAIAKLRHPWGAICFDGQGIAHPRRCGLATHLGVTLDVPAVGVAKSRLTGSYVEPDIVPGSMTPLTYRGQQIGVVLRTREKTRPLFISVGHKVDLDSAVQLVLACRTRYRLPEPTRQADIEVAKLKATL